MLHHPCGIDAGLASVYTDPNPNIPAIQSKCTILLYNSTKAQVAHRLALPRHKEDPRATQCPSQLLLLEILLLLLLLPP